MVRAAIPSYWPRRRIGWKSQRAYSPASRDSREGSGYIDEPVAMIRKWGTSTDTVWYLQGNNYNVEALTDRTGKVVERYAYNPYGAVTFVNNPGPDGKMYTADDIIAGSASARGNSFFFQGRELDAETGNLYFRYRNYSVGMGRFVSRDPIRLLGDTLNLFAFVENLPIMNSDPKGLTPKPPPKCNCLGYALSGKLNVVGDPKQGESLLGYIQRYDPKWSCTTVRNPSACKCDCNQDKMAVVMHKDNNPSNAGLNPFTDNKIIWGFNRKTGIGIDFHALRGVTGCSSECKNVLGLGWEGDSKCDEPSNVDMTEWRMYGALCCCKG